jgi:hypothetical protein
VDASRRTRPADPDFDRLTGPTRGLRGFVPLEHQRLVVNPFLAVLGLLGLIWLAWQLAFSPVPVLSGVALFLILLLRYLIQYHCLDCGRTEPYPRHRGHACPGVFARWSEGQTSQIPYPTARAQLVVWGWLLGAVGVLLAVIAFSRTD